MSAPPDPGWPAFGPAVVPGGIQWYLDCASDATLVATYRTRFFVRAALAEAVMLIGFTTTMRGDGVWLVVVGAAVALALSAVDVPTRASMERADAALRDRGCGRSLILALSGGNGPSGRA